MDEKEKEQIESNFGKKSHWDELYEQEIEQFKNNPELIGYIWFGENVQQKIINYIKQRFQNEEKIIDIGCGNAAFLLSLREEGFLNLWGIDYSENSIDLAIKVIEAQNSEEVKINLFVEDMNHPSQDLTNFDLIHDKGALDAFLLCKQNKINEYIKYILQKINSKNSNNKLIISSCNHAKTELLEFFSQTYSDISTPYKFEFIEEIPHKIISFGGSVGQAVTTLIFKIIL